MCVCVCVVELFPHTHLRLIRMCDTGHRHTITSQLRNIVARRRPESPIVIILHSCSDPARLPKTECELSARTLRPWQIDREESPGTQGFRVWVFGAIEFGVLNLGSLSGHLFVFSYVGSLRGCVWRHQSHNRKAPEPPKSLNPKP